MNVFFILFFGFIVFSSGNVIDSDEFRLPSIYSDDENDPTSNEIEERVTGGIQMHLNDYAKFKYQIGIFIRSIDNHTSLCGGVLVHKQVVLTAAHCVVKAKFVRLFMGTTLKPSFNSRTNIEVQRDCIHAHDKFDSETFENDIATILLQPDDITLSTYVGIIPIASSTWTTCEEGVGWVSGWGRTSTDKTFTPNIIHYVQVKPFKMTECIQKDSTLIKEKQLCTSGDENKGTCEGDSGGPYVLEDKNGERYLCGVNSFGYGDDCADSKPRGKTAVAYYYDNKWICNNSDGLVGC